MVSATSRLYASVFKSRSLNGVAEEVDDGLVDVKADPFNTNCDRKEGLERHSKLCVGTETEIISMHERTKFKPLMAIAVDDDRGRKTFICY